MKQNKIKILGTMFFLLTKVINVKVFHSKKVPKCMVNYKLKYQQEMEAIQPHELGDLAQKIIDKYISG